MKIALYYTDLTDAQWNRIRQLLPPVKKRGRKPKCRRRIIDAVLYITTAGSHWRLLPKGYEPGTWVTD